MRHRGDRHSIRHHEAGFTLVEILVVLAIISLLVGLTSPALKAFSEGRRLRTSAESLQSLCLFARDVAITEQEDHIVVLDGPGQRYWLARASALEWGDLAETEGIGALGPEESETATTGSTTTSGAGAAAAGGAGATSTSATEGVSLRASGILGQARRLAQGVSIAEIVVDRGGTAEPTTSDMEYIRFYANGTAEPSSVYLVNTEGDGVVLEIPQVAARAGVRKLSDAEMGDRAFDVQGVR
jgi:prepilin-type N-terminal cleavage/methylation domain-containing protein